MIKKEVVCLIKSVVLNQGFGFVEKVEKALFPKQPLFDRIQKPKIDVGTGVFVNLKIMVDCT